MEKLKVNDEAKFERLDKYLTDRLDHSRNAIQTMITEGGIKVNGEVVKTKYKVKENDEITIDEIEEKEINIEAEDLPINIIYQDADVLVVDKDHRMVVHPGAGNWSGTLINALLFHVKDFKAIKGEIRPGIVHRIDKETSGLLMVGKSPKAVEDLGDQLRLKTVKRRYLALVEGVIPHNLGKVNAPIGRDPKNRQQMTTIDGGKIAVTNFKVLHRYEKYTLVECILETGRTHQIRVHMRFVGFPIVGDPKYGLRKTNTDNGQFLHAETLGFVHPISKEYLEFHSALPKYFQDFLDNLEAEEAKYKNTM